ncbi:MAG: hypothetical protein IKS96_06130 [Fibrobacter sp.]|nr:hypothetical protein [Fibrobacter sp.]
MRLLLLTIALVTFAFAEDPAKVNVSATETPTALPVAIAPAQDTIIDTIYVIQDDGIPWNREHFDPERLIRHDTFDPALKVAYTYSVSFIGGSFGSFAQQSFMAHFAYEFTPSLHLYANVGLWMPLYSHFRFGTPIAREDVKQGNVGILLPDIALEYKPNDKVTFRIMYVNERDAFRAYGPHDYFYGSCSPWRNSIFCR